MLARRGQLIYPDVNATTSQARQGKGPKDRASALVQVSGDEFTALFETPPDVRFAELCRAHRVMHMQAGPASLPPLPAGSSPQPACRQQAS